MTPLRTRVAIAVALVTIALALVLRWETARHEITGEASHCVFSERVDCDKVQNSKYAKIFGVSLATWGAAAHLLLLAWLLGARHTGPTLLVAAGSLAALNLGFAFYTAYVSWFLLDALCLYCTGMQIGIVLLALLVLPPALRALPGLRRGFEGRLAARGVLLAAVVFGIALPGEAYANDRARLLRLYQGPPGQALRVDLSDTLVLGERSTPHRVVIFFDFGCPFCLQCYEKAVVLHRRYPDRLHFVFKHYPLDRECNPALDATTHNAACRAAVAGQAAVQLGKGEFALDYLFRKQSHGFTPLALDEMRKRLRLDRDAWKAMLAQDGEARRLVDRDIAEGEEMDLGSVPTAYLDGRWIDHDRLTQAVERLLGQ